MNILAFTRYGRLGASSRVRLLQFLPYLEKQGYRVTVNSLLPDSYVEALYAGKGQLWGKVLCAYLKRLLFLLRVFRYDVVWVEKELFPGLPALAERILHLCGVRYVADYDDAIFHNYDLKGRGLGHKILRNKIAVVMRNAAAVSVGNSYLAQYAGQSGTTQVEIIPSVVDTLRYQPNLQCANALPIVGWIGTPPTVKYLQHIAPALAEVQRKYPFLLRVVGAEFVHPDLNVQCRPWSEQSEVEEIQNFDIGIMPLDNTPWEQGKCGYKLIQYMACGKPVVGSPIGINTSIITPNVGDLATTPNDWAEALIALLNNKEKRLQMGQQARIRAQERYSLQVWAPKLAQQFENFAKLK